MADIEFSEELELLQRSAADLMRKRSTFEAVRTAMASPAGYDRELFSQVAELGLLGVAIPESWGGAGLSPGALVPVAEAMGRHLYASPFLTTTLCGQLLLSLGDETAQHRFLPELAGGQAVAALACHEPDGGYEPCRVATTARTSGRDYLLTGIKTGVLDASEASILLVSAICDGAPAVFSVDPAALSAGAITAERLVDESRRSFRVTLTDAPAARIGGDATAALGTVHALGALLVAADMAGGTLGVLDLTLDYLQTRTQFGKPIGGYQALKHPMVDIFVASEQGRSLLYHAATVFDRDPRERERAVRMAKVHCGETFAHASDRSIQFHGAIGFTYECHAQLFFRRAQWDAYQFGDARHHRRHLARLLLDEGFSDSFDDSALAGGTIA